MTKIYDVLTVGGGTAALSAGIYAGRAMVDTLIIEKDKIGGQVTTTSDIVNYPGFRKITGPELTEQMRLQAEDFGCDFATDDIVSVNLDGDVKELTGKSGNTYKSRSVIIATGASPNRIGFPGEKEFTGRGVAYCSTCDGEFFSGLDVFVIGGGYAAAEEAVYLTRYARKVHVIVRKDDFSCAEMTAEQAKTHPQIDITYNTEVKEVSGDGLLQKAVFINNKTGEETIYNASEEDGTFGMFIFAGHKPNMGVFSGIIDTNERGYAVTNEFMETNIPGVYAAGDIRYKELQQIVTAVSDGAIAATKAQDYAINEKKRLGIEHVLKTPSKPIDSKKIEKTSNPGEKPAPQHSGAWFPAEMKDQLAQIFSKLTKPVKLVNILDASDPKSNELSGFLNEFSTISSFISFEEIKKGTDPTFESKVDLTRSPSAALLDENDTYTGIKFSGIPSGHELNSLVLAVYNTGSDGQPLTDDQLAKIKKLPKAKIEICISLTCHFCPDVVAAAQHIAALNPNIQAEMIDTSLFPDLKKEKKIMSVPAMIINDKQVVFGAQTMDQIIEELAK